MPPSFAKPAPRRRWHDLNCRLLFPKCDPATKAALPLCRGDCETFKRQCGCRSRSDGGIKQLDCFQQECNLFPTENCYQLASEQ